MTDPAKMTAEEMAEIILGGVWNNQQSREWHKIRTIQSLETFAAQVREEEYTKACKDYYQVLKPKHVAEGFEQAREMAANVLRKYLTHHNHRFDNGVTLCESGYGAPDSQCVIEIVKAIQPPSEGKR